jgi:predicted permease
VLGVEPMLGRAFTRADDVIGAEHVAILTHGAWQRRYGGARDVLGRRLTVNGQPFTIVGVMPRDVEYPRGVEAWVTISGLASTVANPTLREATLTELGVVARLQREASIAQAATELRALAPDLERAAPQAVASDRIPVPRSFEESIVGDAPGPLMVLLAAAALLLLVAGANVANLLLMRGESRRHEFALRAALGAGRARLVRQTLIESVILAFAAALAGLLLAHWMLPVLMALVPEGLPRVESVRIDARVVLFSCVLAGVAAALAGLWPALVAGRSLAVQVSAGARGVTHAAGRHGRRSLVVAQVALAVVSVAAAGLLARSLQRLQSLGSELAADRLMLVALAVPPEKYTDGERRLQFLTAATERIESSPLVAAATPVNVVPFSGFGWGVPSFAAEGQSREQAAANPSLNLEAVHPNYFDTFDLPLLRGRAFTATDVRNAPLVAIVSEDVAALAWPGQNPLGKRLKMGALEDGDNPWLTVVGVTRPTRYRELTEPRATLYVPAPQLIVTADTFVVRTGASPADIAALVQERVRALDAEVSVVRVAPFGELLEGPLARPRFNAFLAGVFGGAALFLAAVGLYAVMAAFVRMRQREIGVRMALGATARGVRGLVLAEGLRLAAAGGAIGLAVALAGTRVLSHLLFEVDPLDPGVMLGAVTVLGAAAALACYLPARRATRVDPIAVLRAD